MSGQGPAPKDPSKRRRRNVDPIPTTVVEPDDLVRGPALPENYNWHQQTTEWYETWRTSPQAATFTDTDWVFLIDTAMIHDAMWNGDFKLASEVRLRAAKFGATPEDRLRLRLHVSVPEDGQTKATGGVVQNKNAYGHLRSIGSSGE